MSRKARPDKRSSARKSVAARQLSFIRKLNRRTKVIGCILLAAAIAGVTYGRWLPAETPLPTVNENPGAPKNTPASSVKNISTLSENELADIPPEALRPYSSANAGYNASQGGLPPGALPAGVVLPGITEPIAPPPQGYGVSDGVRQQFTQKERDVETGLDYFGARYYSSSQGRFSSPDSRNIIFEKERGKTAEERARILNDFLSNPQNWNQYAYVRNNPLAYRDPNGKCAAPSGLSQGNVGVCIEAFIAAPTFLGIGKGDNRDFAANDPNKSFRIEVQGIFTRGHFDWSANFNPQAGKSEPRISFGYGLQGTVTADVISKSVEKRETSMLP